MIMNPILKNILAVIAGIIIGSIVNMSLIIVSGKIIPPPNGIDVTTEAGLKTAMHLMEPKHFLFPFLAHAVGTLVGAFATAYIAFNHQLKFALVIGCLFLFGGISMIFALKAPMWFNVTDAILAYIPMALLGYFLAAKLKFRH
jgi:hypothetical protein